MIAAPGIYKNAPFTLPDMSKGLLNAGRWLQNQLDETAAHLAWTLLPPLTATTPLRSEETTIYYAGIRKLMPEFETILIDLQPVGVVIPPNARGAYRDFQALGLPVRMYAFVWSRVEVYPPEWLLFIALGPTTGEQLPTGTRLIIEDQQTRLSEQVLTPAAGATYLYTQVAGTWDEQFTATIQLPSGESLAGPPFIFAPNF